MNATLLDTPDSDMVGAFLLDFDDKLIRLDLNLTPDATQNLRLIGHIPDARSAHFDLWRDYEDIHVVVSDKLCVLQWWQSQANARSLSRTLPRTSA